MQISLKQNKKSKQAEAKTASKFPQVHCALTASLGFFISASVIGWTGSSMTKLSEDFKMGATEYSVVASIISYGSLLGCCITGKAMDSFGRRKVLLVTAPLAASGWAVIGFATSVYMVCIGRFMCGFSCGVFFASCSIYANETCQAELRERLGALPILTLAFGTFFAFLVGGLFSWRTSAFLCSLPALILLTNLFLVPESPYWHLLNDDHQSAAESLARLRGPHYDTEKELIEMSRKISDVGTKVSFRELTNRRTLIPLAVAFFVHTSQQLSAGNIISTFTSSIFEKAHSSLDPHMATIYTGVAMVIGTILSIFIIDRYGRRNLLAASVALCGICCGVFGGYFLTLNSEISWPSWAPLAILVCFEFSFSLGCNSIPWLVSSEMFNTTVRSTANAMTTFYNRMLNIIVLQMYPYLVSGFGESVIFLSYAGVCILFAVGILLFVPETKGKSLEQIQEYFESRASNQKGAKEENGPEIC